MILQSFKMAFSSILSNKMRSFLTMLGIIIGVTSLVVLVSLVKGATSSVTEEIAESGNTMISVSITNDKGRPMTLEEVQSLNQESLFSEVAPVGRGNTTVRKGNKNSEISLNGTTPGYFKIQGLKLAYGRWLTNADVDSSTYTAVINYYTAEKLFGTPDVTGQSIIMNGRQYQIVGVLEKSKDTGWNFQKMEAYIPYSTMMRSSEDVKYVSEFCLMAESDTKMQAAEDRITKILLERFNGDKKTFQVMNQSKFMKLVESTQKTMMLMLGGIAGISLIVGGIGIMNIMLVSVTERTREIGIRKAIGADYGSIMLQFLVESIVVSLVGCGIGILLSWGIIAAADSIAPQYHFGLSADIIWISVIFSAAIGVIFGSYPANKAAKKKPIEALRFS